MINYPFNTILDLYIIYTCCRKYVQCIYLVLSFASNFQMKIAVWVVGLKGVSSPGRPCLVSTLSAFALGPGQGLRIQRLCLDRSASDMGGVPFQSKGCQTCKSRKIKVRRSHRILPS